MSTTDRDLDPFLAERLLRDPRWKPSYGLMAGQHWRRELGTGCVHLRRTPDGRYLFHIDKYDPDRRPFSHLGELLVDFVLGRREDGG